MGYAFISYSSAQQKQLYQVREYLQAHDIAFWSAPDDIPIGAKYSEVIKRAIENASCVLFLLSDKSQNSTYCKLEIALALQLEKPIIPIQLEDVILNDDFSLYLSTSEFYPLPRRIPTDKSQRLLNQLHLLCADPEQGPVELADPSYRIGWLKKGTWLQLLGWLWILGGPTPFYALANLCFPIPPRYQGVGGDGLDFMNAPVIAETACYTAILVTLLLIPGLLAICYGYSLNRRHRGGEKLYFKQFSLCQLLTIIGFTGCSISFRLVIENVDHLDHHVSLFLVDAADAIFGGSLLLLLATLLLRLIWSACRRLLARRRKTK